MVKVQVNVVTPRDLNMVYRESNEINGEKIVLSFTAEKKLFGLIRSEKNCTFKLGVEKKFDPEGKTIAPPRIKWSAPKVSFAITLITNEQAYSILTH